MELLSGISLLISLRSKTAVSYDHVRETFLIVYLIDKEEKEKKHTHLLLRQEEEYLNYEQNQHNLHDHELIS